MNNKTFMQIAAIMILISAIATSSQIVPANAKSGFKVVVTINYHGANVRPVDISVQNQENIITLVPQSTQTSIFNFPKGEIMDGESFTVCIHTVPLTGTGGICKEGFNSPVKAPEYITFNLK